MANNNRDPLLDVDQAAELLGTGPRFVRRLIAERRVRYVKLGRHVRIPESALVDYIASNTVEADRNSRVWGRSA